MLMEGHSIEKELQNFFSRSSSEDWKKIAMQETDGKDPFEILSWRGKDGILFLPYCDAEKDAESHFLNTFSSAAATNRHYPSWLNLPSIKTVDAQAANRLALENLMNGADGVLFHLCKNSHPDLNTLINNIEWPHCYIAFYMGDDAAALTQLTKLLQAKFLPAALSGALFWESIPKKSNFDFFFRSFKDIQPLGVVISPNSPAEEISDALVKGLAAYEQHARDRNDLEHVFRSVCFSISADHSFLECAAKFKALRMLWFQIAQACDQKDFQPHDLRIHATSTAVGDITFGPHENMLKGTYAAMAAIIGGCNSLTIETEGTASFLQRWSRNVSPILREESFFDQVADPLAGAYAVNEITDKMAQKAWMLFQHKWKTYATD
jgi:methylmalonyl-CoA mutase